MTAKRRKKPNNSIRRKWLKRLGLLLFWPAGFLISWISAFYPQQVEVFYSRSFSKALAGYVSRVTGIVPLSLAEILIWAFVVIFLALVIQTLVVSLRRKKGNKKKRGFLDLLAGLLIFFGVIYFSFMVIWGLNYNRQPWAETAGLKIGGFTDQDLQQLCDKLITQANSLRSGLAEDEQGVMKINGGFEQVKKIAAQAYAKAAQKYPELGGKFGEPKPVFFSRLMSYTGITGIYFPFTSEANVNIDIPQPTLPATTCHEMAHQRGFAREDEANYLAWVVCMASGDRTFAYSGTVLALMYSMDALYENNPAMAATLNKKYGNGLRKDLAAISQYWKRYEGKVEEISSNVNDTYLKSNRQEEGVKSYGRMVDLLLAEQKADPGKKFLP